MKDLTPRAIAELERTRANLLQVGRVEEADYKKARVRVRLGELTSAWVPWVSARAGGNRSWAAPEVGEQVLVACPDGDPARAVLMGSIYQRAHGAPASSPDVQHTAFGDGASIEYDRAQHRLEIILPDGGEVVIEAPGEVSVIAPMTRVEGDVEIIAPALVTITAPLTRIVGDVEITGAIRAAEGGSINLHGDVQVLGSIHQEAGDFTTSGEVLSAGDQVAAGVSGRHHTHEGVQPGGGTSGEPVA